MTIPKLMIFDKNTALVQPRQGVRPDSPLCQELLPGVAKRLTDLRDADWMMAIAYNQDGIESGEKQTHVAISEMVYCLDLIYSEIGPGVEAAAMAPDTGDGVMLAFRYGSAAAYAPSLSEEMSERFPDCRLPGVGMLQMLREISFFSRKSDPGWTVYVGPPQHKEAALEAGIDFVDASDWLRGFDG